MDKIWDGNPSKSEVIGRCGGDEKTELSLVTDKSRMLKKTKKLKLTRIQWHILNLKLSSSN